MSPERPEQEVFRQGSAGPESSGRAGRQISRDDIDAGAGLYPASRIWKCRIVVGSTEDRREGPGWRDYLLGDPVPPAFTGNDELPLRHSRHKRARQTWHQVLTWNMTEYGGDSVETLAGYIGWFDLRLTHRETSDLFRSAMGDPQNPIEPIAGQNGVGDAQLWRATDKWSGLGKPRGASGKDLLAKVPNAAKTWTGRLLGSVAGAAAIVGAFGWAVKSNTPEARLLVAAGVWLGLVALCVGALRDERGLAAAARAWPRMKVYRPARWAFEQHKLKSPLPYTVIALATIGLAMAGFWTLKARDKLADVPWTTAWVVAGGLIALVAVLHTLGRRRLKRLWAPCQAEKNRRRPLNERSPRPVSAAPRKTVPHN